MKKISYVIPCFNSGAVLMSIVEEIKYVMEKNLKGFLYEIILVNDGSPQNINKFLESISKKYKFVQVFELSRNFGQQSALMCGLNNANGDIIIALDDDGQTPATEIPKLVKALDDDADVVYAKYKTKKHSKFRNFCSRINDWMLQVMLNKPKNLYLSSFFAMKSYVKDEVIKYTNTYPYLMGLVLRITNKVINVETEHKDRLEGNSNYNFKKLISLWVNGLTNFSIKPLRLAIFATLIFCFFALLAIIYLVISKINSYSIPEGWTSTIIVILMVGAVLSLLLGIIGEYIGRIYISINKIPQYVVRNKNGYRGE